MFAFSSSILPRPFEKSRWICQVFCGFRLFVNRGTELVRSSLLVARKQALQIPDHSGHTTPSFERWLGRHMARKSTQILYASFRASGNSSIRGTVPATINVFSKSNYCFCRKARLPEHEEFNQGVREQAVRVKTGQPRHGNARLPPSVRDDSCTS